MTTPIALTIAGSDSGGGAGVQADLKTFAALGVYGASVITSVTAQNTLEVTGIHDLPPDFITLQLDTVTRDLPPDAIKTGMLSNPAIIRAVSERLQVLGVEKLVVDPVMVAKGGAALLRKEAESELIHCLLPLAYVVTPNLGEAAVLTGLTIRSVEGMKEAARHIHTQGARHVVVKGGHLDGPPVDVFFDGQRFEYFEGERIETKSLHGTGCTFASAIAAELAKGVEVTNAVRHAKAYITTAIRLAQPIGHGFGPTHHFGPLYQQAARYDVLLQLEEAVSQLRSHGIAGLIPEVQSNLGLALLGATTLPEVAAWEGRIVRVGTDIHPVGSPRFGTSRHVATMILKAMRVDARYRSAMNIRYGEDIRQACQAAQLRLEPLASWQAALEARRRDGSSGAWGSSETMLGMGSIPDILYDLGAIGQEAMVWVLGQDAMEVSHKVLRIRHFLPEH
jgi:hydroxymethylpyrimidine kinase / phosphomethylpyrimidine kinase / thiamine-phosphate diphosphorylase